MKTFYLTHVALFPNFNTIVPDELGYFVISKEPSNSDRDSLHNSLTELSFAAFTQKDSGLLDFVKNEFSDSESTLNSLKIRALLPVCPNVVSTDTLTKEAKGRQGITTLSKFINTRLKTRDALLQVDGGAFAGSNKTVNQVLVGDTERSDLVKAFADVFGPLVSIDCLDSRFPTGYRMPQDNFPDKGVLGGRCNVNACQKPGSAYFYNSAMRSYYCLHCAEQIHKANRGHCTDLGPLFLADTLFNARSNKAVSVSELEGQQATLKEIREGGRQC